MTQLLWYKVRQNRTGNDRFMADYWVTPCESYTIIPAVDKFLLRYNNTCFWDNCDLSELKKIAQKHYEENN